MLRAVASQVLAGTWASKPAASDVGVGTVYRASDVGPSPGITFVSDGTRWIPDGVQILARNASASGMSVTGTLSETALVTVTVPAGVLGINGSLIVQVSFAYTNSANTKTMRIRFGGLAGTQYLSAAATTTATLSDQRWISNRGAANSQVGGQGGVAFYGTSTNTTVTSSVDTTADTTLLLTGTLANTGETIAVESYRVLLTP